MLQDSTPAPLPLIELEALAQLEQQLNDPAPVRAFARDFITMFEDRYLHLAQAVENQNFDAALKAALGLRNSSKMVGAARLAAMAAGFEAAIISADLETARASLPGLQSCGFDTIGELTSSYLTPAAEESGPNQESDTARIGVSL